MLLLTIAQVFVIGQMVFLLGLFPLCLGYYFYCRKRYVAAGLAWSVLSIKPSYLVAIVLFLAPRFNLDYFKQRDFWRAPLGLLLGVTILLGASTIAFGLDFLPRWIHYLQLFSQEIRGIGMAPQNIISITSTTLNILPDLFSVRARPLLTAFSISAGLGLIYMFKRLDKTNLSNDEKIDLTFCASLLSLPLLLPYFRLYDFTLFLLVAWIFCLRIKSSELQKVALKLGLVLLVVLDVYFLAFGLWQNSNFVYLVQYLILSLISALIFSIFWFSLRKK